MRPDMGRVVIEKERRGSSNPSAKVRYYGEFGEDGEYYGPMKLPSSGWKNEGWLGTKRFSSKDFSDVLNPIYGYLRKSCGRPWDKVYSEICKVLGSGGYPIRHVLYQHLLPEVIKDYGRFKVDRNGILRETERRRRWRRRDETRETRRVQIAGDHWYCMIDGIWYIGTYRKSSFDSIQSSQYLKYLKREHLNLAEVEWPHFRDGYRGPIWVFTKIKQCSKKELRDLRAMVDR